MSSLSTLPKGDSAWLLRKAIERIMEQVSVLETNIGSSTTGNSANTQIIFNDAGTLRGDAGLVYNKTTDALTVTGLVTAGSATITGALTVDTSTLVVDATNDRVGFGTASPAQFVHLSKSNTSTALTSPPVGNASFRIQNTNSTNNNFGSVEFYNAAGLFGASVNCQYTNQTTPTNDLVFVTRGSSGGLEHYRIAADGVATWSEVGGIAGTAMTLNSTGLGIGAAATSRLTVNGEISVTDNFALRLGSTQAGGATLLYNGSGNLDITPRSGFHTKLVDGNLIIGTSGKGIDFSAVTGGTGTATANVLNDYEEGTWTGTLNGGTTNPTVPVTATGKYTKVGRQVTVAIYFFNVSTVGASGSVNVIGLPFTEDGTRAVGTVAFYNFDFNGGTGPFVDVAGATMFFQSQLTNSNWRDVNHSAGVGRYLRATLTYFV